ncbi:ATPase, histidine kinase-, DNA gyrase B-, and HSP90-like domain-containing protein [Isoalcanivorax pacificus W11-5]|uniref:histidine kinase n=1 Tax=Isoalcanivorax pacificus W11-5 TaxID=391936 RepID=A0A0B4XNI1_9GAMM|nr:hybrid sensor histidine kinase/response regulator [Isoalcanivorax pacificus]AJD47857.1 ATPase, histidine kinase-, DNA gyrase B-, and HSP90-like domain-containing protein [Isoalcanivorax pacificus W11-5]
MDEKTVSDAAVPPDERSPWDLHEARLMAENARLKRICDALIERVEASNMAPTAPYAAFQHSVVLAEQVRERTQALREVNKQLLAEIEERRRMELRLREATEKAEQANLSKTRFVAAVSHDLMQPLNAARLFTSALQENPDHNTAFQLSHISTALRDLESLITTLSDASKLDAGVVTAEIGVFPLRRLLDVLAEEFRQMAQQKGLRFRYVPTSLLVRSDPQLLSRIMRNLLSNAVRYTESGTILLGCRRVNGQVEVMVADTGIGIRQDQIGEIFEEFKRGKQAVRYHERGLGLGLAIVEKISQILAHPLRVRSRLSEGSCFSLTLPVAPPSEYNARVMQAGQLASHSLLGLRVWVVDNDEAICIGMRTLLEQWGCEVVVAESLSALRAQVDTTADEADVVLMDYHLDPGTDDGITVAEFINAGRRTPLPVILVTADRSARLKQRCAQSGYMQVYKPIKPLKLKMALQQFSGAMQIE